MKRTVLAVIFAALAPLAFGQADETGAEPVRTPDRSTTCTLDSLNDTCSVALEGRNTVGLQITTTNLSASVLGETSYDGGTTWAGVAFLDIAQGVSTGPDVFTGAPITRRYEFQHPGGARHARVRVTAYTSGTATAIIAATVEPGSQRGIEVMGRAANSFFAYLRPVEIGGVDSGFVARSIRVDPLGRLETTPAQLTSSNNDGACVSVTASTTVLASLATRKAFTVFARETNTDVVYIKMGATATSSDFPLPAGSAYNMQAGVVYTGVIDAIAASGTQSVCVVEF